jgi:hypothetical protein
VSGCWRKKKIEKAQEQIQMKGLLKRRKRKKVPKIKKEMEYPKAHRIGRRSAREFKNPKEISKKPQIKINMLTKIPKERRKKIQYTRRKKKFISFIYKEMPILFTV